MSDSENNLITFLNSRLTTNRDDFNSDFIKITVGAIFFTLYMILATCSMGYAKKI